MAPFTWNCVHSTSNLRGRTGPQDTHPQSWTGHSNILAPVFRASLVWALLRPFMVDDFWIPTFGDTAMTTLTVWKFPDADAAEQATETLSSLQSQGLINVEDEAYVTWPADKKKPSTHQEHHLVGAGALGGGFWGLLFGLIFFIPLIGLVVGAAVGALSASMVDVGIDDNFIKQVRSEVTPGTSALFVLTSDAVEDRVLDAFKSSFPDAKLIFTNLSKEQEANLRQAFSD